MRHLYSLSKVQFTVREDKNMQDDSKCNNSMPIPNWKTKQSSPINKHLLQTTSVIGKKAQKHMVADTALKLPERQDG